MHTTPTTKPAHSVPPPRQPWYRQSAAIFAAAVIVTILAAIPLYLFRSTAGDVAEDTVVTTTTPMIATTAPVAAPAVPPTTTPPPPATTIPPLAESWQRVGADVTDAAYLMMDMNQVGSRLVAVGFYLEEDPDDPREHAVILASDDGVAWTRLAADDPALTTGGALMRGVIEGGPGMVAVGNGCDGSTTECGARPWYPTVWRSADGTIWARTQVDTEYEGAMEDAIVTDHGIIATGWIAGPNKGSGDTTTGDVYPAIWLSTTGDEWERVYEGDPNVYDAAFGEPGLNRVLALAAGPDGLIVGVGSTQNSDGEEVAAVWTSTDGRTWGRTDPEDSMFGSETGRDVSMIDVASGPSGFIAVGNEAGSEIAVWQSPDGRSWTRIDTKNQPFADTGVLSAVAPIDTGWAAAGFGPGWAEGPVTLWTSPDGITWRRAVALDVGWVQQMVATGDRAVIAGAMVNHAAIWTGTATTQN